MDLNVIWFLVIGILLTGYVCLDGFDYGVGGLHLLTKSNQDRRIFLNAIGPIWDGNEVWLVTGGGALFAAFPRVYASVFSGFYIAFMLFLLTLVLRAVSIEFRSKKEMKWWRDLWDIGFSVSSLLASVLLGIALGNLVTGIPLNEKGDFTIGFLELIHPYSLLMGLTALSFFLLHGAVFLLNKTEGELQSRVLGWFPRLMIFFLVCYAITTAVTILGIPHMTEMMKRFPALGIFSLLNLLMVIHVPLQIFRKNYFRAFLSSSGVAITLMILFGIGMFPNFVYSSSDPQYSLTLYNASSSRKTLSIMLGIAGIAFPFVLAYTSYIYWVFGGKVKLDSSSY